MKKGYIVYGLLCCGIAAGLWAILRHEAVRNVRRLPDGSSLTLRGAVYEQAYRFPCSGGWRDYIGPVLPAAWAKKVGCRFLEGNGSPKTLTFGLEWDGLGRHRPAGALYSRPDVRACTFDEHGCEFSLQEAHVWAHEAGSNSVVLCHFKNFPRLSKKVGLRFYQRQTNGAWATLAEYLVRNPDKHSYARFAGEPLPSTKRHGNTEFTLEEVATGVVDGHSPPEPLRPGERPGVCLKFRLRQNGQASSGWGLNTVSSIADLPGFEVSPGSYGMMSRAEGELWVDTRGDLCAHAPAWKVAVGFVRTKDFPSNELWMVEHVAVPADNAASAVDVTTNIYGARLQLCGIIGKECQQPKERRSMSEWPVAHLVCNGLGDDLRLQLVRAVDDRGRDVMGRGSSSSSGNYFYALSFERAPDAKHLDLTFAVTRSVRVEFQAKPTKFKGAGKGQ